MKNIHKFEILDGCRLPLKFTNLYNKTDVYIKAVKIPNFLIYIFILLPMIYIISLQIWFCIDERFNLASMSNTLCYGIGFTQMTLVYVSLVMRFDSIKETTDHLQDVVDKSNVFLDFY